MPTTTVLTKPDATLDSKFRREILLGRYVANPLMRGMFKVGLTPPMHTLIETTGRKSGLVRTVPVTYHRDGNTVWIIAQHGRKAGWVRNLMANPTVRLRLSGQWLTGTATIQPDDDVKQRIATFSRNPALRTLIASTFVALETRPMTVRVDLQPA